MGLHDLSTNGKHGPESCFLVKFVDSSGAEIHLLLIHLQLLNATSVALKLLFSVHTFPGNLMTFMLLALATRLPV